MRNRECRKSGRLSCVMSPRPAHEYVLGTHDAERDRLARQHALWAGEVLRAWRNAGIGLGSRVLDLGCGPGVAVEALLDQVGPTGHVAGLELSPEFAAQAHARATARGRPDADIRTFDLMSGPLPADLHGAFDAVWCRWVAMFVRDPAMLARAAADALCPGGSAVFHEYVDYRTYSLCPHGPRTAEFVERAMKSYAQHGGDANVARRLPALLAAAGLRVTSMRPVARAARPDDPLWHWPAGFVRTYAPRLVALGLGDDAWLESLLAELDSAERGEPDGAFLVTPTVLEIVAARP
jgi:SAM-dependent methyltransferase